MTNNEAVSLLEARLHEIARLKSLPNHSLEFQKWQRDTKVAIKNIFANGDGSHVSEFENIRYSCGVYFSGMPDHIERNAFIGGLNSAGEMLKSMIEEKKIYDSTSQSQMTVDPNSRKVFIVHGHDDSVKQTVARFIEKLDLEPVILHEQSNEGRTIIEKFEHHSNVGFAVVLLTPDDVGASVDDKMNLKPRARQNVILELGFFMGKLGRGRVCALYKNVDMPSDFHGVLYLQMDNNWQFGLAKEISKAGINVDMNKLI